MTFDPSVPNIARVYNYLLGGKDNFPADREFAAQLIARFPEAEVMARVNREFLIRAVGYLAEAGIGQFLDLGSGLPTMQNVHQVAQEVNPDARVVYVDNDPVVAVHGRALLADNANTGMVSADMRHPTQIIGHPEVTGLINFAEPLAVLFVSVLHFLPGIQPRQIINAFRLVMAPGSHLVISHAEERPTLAEATALYRDKIGTGYPRTRAQIAGLLEGLDVVAPGLVRLPAWRPDRQPHRRPDTTPPKLPFLGGIARLQLAGEPEPTTPPGTATQP